MNCPGFWKPRQHLSCCCSWVLMIHEVTIGLGLNRAGDLFGCFLWKFGLTKFMLIRWWTQRGMNDDDGKTIKRTRSWSGHALQLLLYRSKCFLFTWGLSAWRYILFVMEIWDMDLKEHWLFDLCIVKTWPCAARYYCNVVLSNRCTIWEDDQTMCGSMGLINLHHHRLQRHFTCTMEHPQLSTTDDVRTWIKKNARTLLSLIANSMLF